MKTLTLQNNRRMMGRMDGLIGTGEAAKRLGITRARFYQLVHEYEIVLRPIPSYPRFHQISLPDLEKLAARNTKRGRKPHKTNEL